jgi:tetratricopeptide (TPR) repeat protein
MPLFGSSKRPKLDGLTKEEEKRRDELNPEVMRRAGEGGVAGQGPAALQVLKEKVESDKREALWPLLLGWQLMSMRRYTPAIEAFNESIARDADEIRAFYGAGSAYYQAGEAKQSLGPAVTEEVAPADMTVDNLFHEAGRLFRRALDMTKEKSERDLLQQASGAVEKALSRKAGRL